jgi:hypothetical protein
MAHNDYYTQDTGDRMNTETQITTAPIVGNADADRLLDRVNQAQLHSDPQQVLADAALVYQEAAFAVEGYQTVQRAAKSLISEVFTETGETEAQTPTAKILVTRPSTSAKYDAKALDALCASDPNLARILAPHRSVSERAGTLMIRAARS